MRWRHWKTVRSRGQHESSIAVSYALIQIILRVLPERTSRISQPQVAYERLCGALGRGYQPGIQKHTFQINLQVKLILLRDRGNSRYITHPPALEIHKILDQLFAPGGKHALGMELDSFNRQLTMTQPHDHVAAVFLMRAGADL